MAYEHLIALRYIVSKRQIGFVSLISVISIAGVTIGVAALVIVLSVFNGFGSLVTSILVSFDPHIRVERIDRSSVHAYESLMKDLESEKHVQGFSPFVSGKALVVTRNSNRVVNIKGLIEERVKSVSGLRERIVLGSLRFHNERNNGIILGMTLADRLGSVVGDTVSIVSPVGAELAAAQMGLPVIRRFVVEGIYESNNKDYDSFYAFTSLEAAQSLFNADSMIDGVELRLNRLELVDSFSKRLEEKIGGSFRVLTWYDLHRELYTVMQIERWSAYIILCLIVAVASFNLLGSLSMTVIEKTRDLGILKSMGATNHSIQRIFLLQGLLVGIVGTVLGLGLGILVVYLQDHYHLFPLDPTVYIISALPVELRLLDIVVIAFAAIGLSALASRRPARRAAQLLPAEAIRWE